MVPSGRYSSLISPGDANQKALDEITANGQAYANSPDNRVCVVDTDPDWEWLPGAATRCQTVNGQLPPHLFVLATDVNPNSYTYLQTAWQDAGPNDACPSGNYYNDDQSGDYYSSNCPYGQAALPYYVQVPPGMFSSTVSQTDANTQAQQWAMSQADMYGSCQSNVQVYFNNYGNVDFYIELYNESTGLHYYYNVSPFTTGNWIEVPEGTYTINIYANDPYYYSHYAMVGCGYYNWGYSTISFSGIYLGSYCNNIDIDY